MWPLLATVGPRILIPSFFIGQKVSTIHDPAVIAQTIAFSFLFVCFAITVFSDRAWLALIPGIAAWAYWKMLHDEERVEKYRYMDWGLTTPLMLLAILVTNKVSPIYTIGIMISDMIMIGSGYIGAMDPDLTNKMMMFIIGCIAFVPILYALFKMKKAKWAVSLTLMTWILYPILWYVDETSLIAKQTTTITYSVMDVVAKVGLVNLLQI